MAQNPKLETEVVSAHPVGHAAHSAYPGVENGLLILHCHIELDGTTRSSCDNKLHVPDIVVV